MEDRKKFTKISGVGKDHRFFSSHFSTFKLHLINIQIFFYKENDITFMRRNI